MSEEHHLSSDAEYYQYEIRSLKTQVKSLEFQIADLKTYIVNQRNMHTREMEACRMSERELQDKVAKLTKEPSYGRNHQLIIKKSLKETKDQSAGLLSASVVKELLSQAFTTLETASSSLIINLGNKVNVLATRLRKSQLYLANTKLVAETHRDNQELLLTSLRNALHYKNSMLDRQNKLIDQMADDKKDSDLLYERHLTFLESARDQKKVLFDRLERANTELHQFTSLRDSMAMRRVVYGSISFTKDYDSKHDPYPSIAVHATLPHFSGFPHRTSNPTALSPFDDNANSCYHKTMIDVPIGSTERYHPLKDNRTKLKECFRRAMSNLASPEKYTGSSQKCLQLRSPINLEITAVGKPKVLNTNAPAIPKKKIGNKRVDLTTNNGHSRHKYNMPFC